MALPHPNPSPEGEGLNDTLAGTFPFSFRRRGQGMRCHIRIISLFSVIAKIKYKSKIM
jgi:hypothetical protein